MKCKAKNLKTGLRCCHDALVSGYCMIHYVKYVYKERRVK